MSSGFEWQSDGVIALVALVTYGLILLLLVLTRVRHIRAVKQLLPSTLLWHLAIWAFIAFWLNPYYVSRGSDSYGYHINGIIAAASIRAGNWSSLSFRLGSDTIPIISGLIYAPFGADIYGMTFFSAVLGLCGCFYYCRAFSQWFTRGELKTYSLVILFLPSLATWTSLFGKDSWIAVGLGLASYGYSSLLKGRTASGMWHVTLGITIITLIRPHVALIFVAAMTISYFWGLTQLRSDSWLKKLATIALFATISVFVGSIARGYIGLSDVSADNVDQYMRTQGAGNFGGDSAVDVQVAPGIGGALRAFPRGIVRVLFEPFPWEVNSLNSGLAAIENLFLLYFVVSRARRLRMLFRGIAQEPYVRFSLALAGGLLLMLSFTPNLGLLSRERAQLLPFLFVPLAAAGGSRRRTAGLTYSAAPSIRPHQPRVDFSAPQGTLSP